MEIKVTSKELERPAIINPYRKNYGELRQKRLGVMLHYDDSSSDGSAVEWFRDPRCEVSYNYLILDDGSFHVIAPFSMRAWHAGVCKPSTFSLHYEDANSAFFGIAVATNTKTPATMQQIITAAALTNYIFTTFGWPKTDLHRITGHHDEAWPRSRRIDPYGEDMSHPIFNPKHVQELFPITRFV